MANTNDEARIPVYLNNEQAKSAIENLTKEADKFGKKMAEALAAGDMKGWKEYKREFDNADKSLKSIKRSSFDVNEVLSRISTASPAELNRALKAVNKEINNATRGTKEWMDAMNKKSTIIAEQKIINSALVQQTGLFGKVSESLNNIPGAAGSAVSGLMGVGKAMWALVANPIGATIAAIVASLMLLYKAFTSTDTGANALAGTLKAIGNVMDIVIDRAMSYYKMLWSIITLDFKGVKENAVAAFGGIGKAIKDATNAGWDYAHTMDDIDDREAAAQIRMSKLGAEIEKLKNQSKESNRTTKEKIALEKEALDKSIELNSIEKGFLLERTDAETKNLASKIQNSKLSMAQKEAQLNQWLQVDDKELASLTEKDKAFAEFNNKNETEFQALQKQKSEAFNKDEEFQKENRRLLKSFSADKQALLDEDKKRVEDAQKKAYADLENSNRKELNLIKQRQLEVKASEEDYNKELEEEEINALNKKLALQIEFGDDYSDTMSAILDKQLKIQEDIDKKAEDEKKKSLKKELDDLSSQQKNELALLKKDALAKGLSEEETNTILISKEINFLNKKLILEQKYGQDTIETTAAITAKINELAENAIKGDEDRAKELADLKKRYDDDELTAKQENINDLAALDKLYQSGAISSYEEYQRLKSEINKKYENARLQKSIEFGQKAQQFVSLGSNMVQSLMDAELAKAGDNEEKKAQIKKKYATAQFLMAASEIVVNTAVAIMQGFAQLGPIGGAIAAVMLGATGIAQLAIANSERQKMQSFSEGGHTGPGGKYEPAGIVHRKEYVIPEEGTEAPGVRPFIDLIEIARKNGSLARLDLRPVMASVITGRGYSSGGAVGSPASPSSSPIIVQTGSGMSDSSLSRWEAIVSRFEDMQWNFNFTEFEKIQKRRAIREKQSKL